MSMLIGSLTGLFSRRWLWLAPTLALVLVLAGLGWHIAHRLGQQAAALDELRLALALAERGRAAAVLGIRECEAAATMITDELARTDAETARIAAEVARVRGTLRARIEADHEAPSPPLPAGCRLDDGQRRAWAELDAAIAGLCDREPGVCPLERLRSPEPAGGAGDPGRPPAGAAIAPPMPRPSRGRAALDDRPGDRPLRRGGARRRCLPPPPQGGRRHPDPQRSPGWARRRDER
jgi:hypothetical protein